MDPSDKLDSERLRYFNGLAYQKGLTANALSTAFQSLGVTDAMEAGVEAGHGMGGVGSRASWPSAGGGSGAQQQQQVVASIPSTPTSIGSSAQPLSTQLFASSAPTEAIPGRRSAVDGGSAAHPRRAPTFDDARAPVATAYGTYIQPMPSPFKGKRRALVEGGSNSNSNSSSSNTAPHTTHTGGVYPEISARSLQDHLHFGGEGLTTKVGSSVAAPSLRAQSSVRGNLTLVEKRALWLQSGAAVAHAMGPEGQPPQDRVANMERVGVEVFPASGSVAPVGKKHVEVALKGENLARVLQDQGGRGCVEDAPRRVLQGGNPLDKVIPKEEVPPYIRRALKAPPPEILQSHSNPTRKTAVY